MTDLDWGRCPRCLEYRCGASNCNCQPFSVVDEDDDEATVWALDKESAARRYAEETNECNDYYLIDNSMTITVNGTKYVISAEPSIDYRAREVSE